MFGRHILKLRAAVGDRWIGRVIMLLRIPSGRWLLRGPHTQDWEAKVLLDPEDYVARYPDVRGWDPWAHYLAHGAREGRDPNPLFDTSYYLERYPDVAAGGLNPFVHYIVAGAREGRDPHPLMRTAEYLERHPAVASSGANPLAHYLAHGGREGCWPNPLFDSAWYIRTYPQVGGNPLVDYVTVGAAVGRNPHPLFDSTYYLNRNADLKVSGRNPLEHYLSAGSRRSRPHPLFDTEYYLRKYPEVGERGVIPLVHYLYYGAALGCRPHPLFDTDYYRATYADLLSGDRNPLEHFVSEGAGKGLFPNPLFDTAWYLETYADVAQAGRNPLVDFCERAPGKARRPNVLFDPTYYLGQHPAAAGDAAGALEHYLEQGAFEGFNPCLCFDSSYYLAQHGEVVEAGKNPLAHYLYEGGAFSSHPHPLFNTTFYRRRYVGSSEEVPLVHFLTAGWREGCWPNPLFDPGYYLAENPKIADKNPLGDYLAGGAAGGRNPNAFFDTSYYRERYLDADESRNPLDHYLHAGAYQGCNPSPRFDSAFYLEENPDVAAAGINPLAHYIWIGREQGRPALRPAAAIEAEWTQETAPDDPKVSVLMPVYNTPAKLLALAVDSVRNQTCRNWELCMVDDGSTDLDTCRAFAALAGSDGRIKTRTLWSNRGISGATNAAFEMTTGELIALLDHDDELRPEALAAVVNEFRRHPEAQAVYTDHEVIEEDGAHSWVFSKPDWSPELFRGVMYAGHLLALRRETLVHCRGFDSRFDGVQDFELLLRLSERTREIRHIRRVLYRWRKAPGSVAFGQERKPGIQERHRAAVNAHLERLGVPARAVVNERHPDLLQIEPTAEPEKDYCVLLGDLPGDVSKSNLLRHLALYASMPGVACVSPMVLRADGRVHDAGVLAGPKLRYAYSGWDPASSGHGGSLACAREVSLISGVCGLIAKERLAELGGIGDRFTSARYQLLDLAVRASAVGFRNIVTPAVRVQQTMAAAEFPSTDHQRFVGDWERELERPDPYSHAGFDHPSHLPMEDSARVERMESWLSG